ncbi:phospho-sugar mutase [Staphylococcus gallinarum]|uniref:phospho-sugar mutase n=1 Tax=Staphylococcus gallinarum TaxID=1293 RepID=UPI001E59BE5C|nr:phospho-sugar mutase [Staphylococcus gallinarum]MCD8909543.1 phospho-sugar mutase [Staphylococcus gallinarum]
MINIWENHKEESLVKNFYNLQSKETQNEGFETKLMFGTAGIRGKFGLGEGRLNKYTISKVALGIANYLNDFEKSPSVVIHYDTRYLSPEFSRLIAEILASNNIKVYVTDTYRTTPDLSFAVRYLKASAGLMVTASHNPKDYNGIKVYGNDGAQITTETSKILGSYIDELGNALTLENKVNEDNFEKYIHLTNKYIRKSYVDHIQKLVGDIPTSDLKVIFSSLHGTSVPIIPEILESLNFNSFSLVDEQCVPDPDFSSVKSANPEDKKAFDESIFKANELKADLIICTDPDADRLGIVERDGEGNIHYYNGNEIGALLLNYRIKQTSHLKNRVMMQSIVTSELGKNIARKNNITVKEVLTGFKFIAEEIRKIRPEENFIFGYEESYGYLAEPFVRDKDAIQIVPLIIKYASELKQIGRMLKDELNDIYNEVGKHSDKLYSHIFEGIDGKQKIDDIMQSMRNLSLQSIANLKVIFIEDYEKQERLNIESKEITKIDLPKANVIKIYFENGFIALRPSGTEPKIKLYISLKYENVEGIAEQINKEIFEM